jgi:uncharacterized protein YbaR (Trm112 family)/2-polyprenyl-3-methyl-5-hydroxy-6-metoxy-1,4-benzoquinol methylase
MRHSLVDILACPVTGAPLTLMGATEVEMSIPQVYISASAINQERNLSHAISDALLVEPQSGRWYPVQSFLPILLPDSLRDWSADMAFLATFQGKIDVDLFGWLEALPGRLDRASKLGDNHKNSELSLLEKVENRDLFLGPGYVAPFNWGAYEHSAALVRGFSVCLPFLDLQRGDFVLDSGSGYSWTTEWLQMMGINSVGIEINRTYLDVGRGRMGNVQPHLVVCDAENLPFKADVFKGVLGFDAFHHIPNRNRAMVEFSRTMKPGGRVVLVEPGSAHTTDAYSIEIMDKYGTMEVGMDLDNVRSYIRGIDAFAEPQEHFLMPMAGEREQVIKPNRSFIGWSLFTIDHPG